MNELDKEVKDVFTNEVIEEGKETTTPKFYQDLSYIGSTSRLQSRGIAGSDYIAISEICEAEIVKGDFETPDFMDFTLKKSYESLPLFRGLAFVSNYNFSQSLVPTPDLIASFNGSKLRLYVSIPFAGEPTRISKATIRIYNQSY